MRDIRGILISAGDEVVTSIQGGRSATRLRHAYVVALDPDGTPRLADWDVNPEVRNKPGVKGRRFGARARSCAIALLAPLPGPLA